MNELFNGLAELLLVSDKCFLSNHSDKECCIRVWTC